MDKVVMEHWDVNHRIRTMRIYLVLLVTLTAVLSSTGSIDAATAVEDHQGEGVLCTKRMQLRYSERCGQLGPSAALEDYARIGLYPEQPLPTLEFDDSYAYLPYSYLRVSRNGADLFSSLNDALNNRNSYRRLSAGFLYVSYVDRYDDDGQVVYRTSSGAYIRGDNVSRISTSTFHGLLFSKTPARSFGWIMSNGFTRVGPGYQDPQTDHYLYRYEVVQVYDMLDDGETVWYMIGPGEWIEQRSIAKLDPNPTPPQGVDANRWITVDVFEQTLGVYEDGELIFATAVSSGLQGWWTYPGLFQVHDAYESDTMRGSFEADNSDYYYLEDVPWVLYFDDARAMHGAYWHNNFGFPQSHGCVNLSPTDAHWVYEWADEGTWVYVFDPSGVTPLSEDDA